MPRSISSFETSPTGRASRRAALQIKTTTRIDGRSRIRYYTPHEAAADGSVLRRDTVCQDVASKSRY